jgi:3-dehydroquinate synthetase
MAGYAASIYKRGVKLVLVPPLYLAMVDAAVGGKNGVDVGHYKNMVAPYTNPTIVVLTTSSWTPCRSRMGKWFCRNYKTCLH